MNYIESAWVSGLLEGEGSFFTATNGYSPQIQCQMTDHDILLRLQSICGGNIYEITKRQPHWKDCWMWKVGGDLAASIMEQILPNMGSRRSRKISGVLELWYTKGRPSKSQDSLSSAVTDYMAGRGTYRSLEAKYGIGRETIRRAVKDKDYHATTF